MGHRHPRPHRAPQPAARSTITRTAAERRLGLFLTVSRAYYDGREERGEHVSQSDRLGDTITNGDSKTGRHNKFNRACRDAVAAKSITAVILGDKGDGSAKARAAAKAKVWTHPPKTLLRVVLSSASVLLSLS